MKQRPADVIAFSAAYFKAKAMKQRHARAHAPLDQGGSVLARKAPIAYRNLPVLAQERIEQLFDAFDENESGSIERTELFKLLQQIARALGEKVTEAEAHELFQHIDADGSGTITWPEFSGSIAGWVQTMDI
mmetsp:Transcript_10457/g.28481  ORF Transcript_10457/g.28481 Transcript_10457/m.28481 type:complete len:132 (+) Transcript_10457:2-397(+)